MRYFILLFVLLFSFCTESQEISGGSEIGSPTLSGVMDSAVANAQIQLIPTNYRKGMDSSQILKTLTDTEGKFSFPELDTSKSYSFLAQTSTGMMHYHHDYSFSQEGMYMGTLKLTKPMPLDIQLTNASHKIYEIILLGTQWAIATDALGKCHWKSIPEGTFQVYYKEYSSSEEPKFLKQIEFSSTQQTFTIPLP